MRKYILFTFVFVFACTQKQSVPIIGIWKCVSVKRIETPIGENMPTSLGKELAMSEIVSDSLIIQSDTTYEQYNSAFGIHNIVRGTYFISHRDKKLLLIKNADAPGTERSKEFSIKKLSNDTLLLKDAEGFEFIYLLQGGKTSR